jgi:OOP family OmpA-OmpF porin
VKALLTATCLLAGFASAPAGAQQPPALPEAPIVASGTLPDEASKAALLARLREVYGANRVVDQLAIGTVATPANWNAYLHKLINPNLKMVSRGQLKVDGNAVTLRGDVANDAQRQQIANDIATALNPTYTVNNGLRVAASEQAVLDTALGNRIIEFDSGKATLAESGMAILDQMSVALRALKNKKVEVIGHTDNAGARGSGEKLYCQPGRGA